MNVTIIGSGNMAKGIGTRILAGGHSLVIQTRNEAQGRALVADLGDGATSAELGSTVGDLVILALPYTEIAGTIERYNGFEGKTVIDITNPIDFATFQLIPEVGTSGAEEIAKLAPKAHIVKAFNTTFAGPLVAGEIAGKPLDVFIVGDDAGAKKQVTQLVTDGGLHAIDFGALSGARHLEGFQYLHMAAQESLGTGWMSGIALAR